MSCHHDATLSLLYNNISLQLKIYSLLPGWQEAIHPLGQWICFLDFLSTLPASLCGTMERMEAEEVTWEDRSGCTRLAFAAAAVKVAAVL